MSMNPFLQAEELMPLSLSFSITPLALTVRDASQDTTAPLTTRLTLHTFAIVSVISSAVYRHPPVLGDPGMDVCDLQAAVGYVCPDGEPSLVWWL